MRKSNTPGWYVEDDIAASVRKARKSNTPHSSIVCGLEATFSDNIPKGRINRIVESVPDDKTESTKTDIPLSQPPSTDAQPREQPARIISIRDISYLSPREAARVIGLTLEQFDKVRYQYTVRPPANESTECNLYWKRRQSTVGVRVIPVVENKVSKNDILPLNEGKTSIDSVQSPSQLVVVTNGELSKKAKETAEKHDIRWYDGGHVEVWLRRAKITPEALGDVLENGENHQGPLDELVDISGIADDISLNPLEISRVIDPADLSTRPETEQGTQASSSNKNSQNATEDDRISQPDTPSVSGETGTLYADASEDGDYDAFDRFVDGIESDSSTSASKQKQNRTTGGVLNNNKSTRDNRDNSNDKDATEYECAVCGAMFDRQVIYKEHIGSCMP
jgi:hypothetical protein